MESNNSKLVVGLIAGAAVGAAIGYLLASDKQKEEWAESVGEVVRKAKQKLDKIVGDTADDLESVADKADEIVSKAKKTMDEELGIVI